MKALYFLKQVHFLSVVCFAIAMNADAETPVEYWKRMLADKSIKEISALMESKAAPAWPEIRSVRQLEDAQSDAKLSLVKALHAKLKKSVEAGSATMEDVSSYSKISTHLQTAGGYSNMLLADCFNRVVLFRVTGWLVEKTRTLNEVKSLVAEWNVPSANDPRTWLERFQDDDPSVKAARDNFSKVQPGVMFFPGSIGIKNTDVDMLDPKNQAFSKLIEQPSVLALLWRLAGTEKAKVVNVRGFILFLEKGGKREELDPKDGSAFERRMGQDIAEIKYAPFDHRYLSLTDIEFCFALHDNPSTKAVTLDVALK